MLLQKRRKEGIGPLMEVGLQVMLWGVADVISGPSPFCIWKIGESVLPNNRYQELTALEWRKA